MTTIDHQQAPNDALTMPSFQPDVLNQGAAKTEVRRASGIVIREVQTRRDLAEFVWLPWSVYAQDPNWVPPLVLEVKAFLNKRKHPFYLHGHATQFLAFRDSRCVGRILVSDDPRFNAENNANVGCFGMFESINDQAVAGALVDAAAQWSKQWGRDELRGPIDYSMSYPCGLLIEGFDTPQRVMMNHNPPYYASLLTGCGLTKAKDLYAWWFDDSFDMLTRWARRAQRLAGRGHLRIRPLSLKNFDAEVALCNSIYNQMLEKSWGFVPMTPAEFRYHAAHLRQFAVPDWILIAEVDGEPAGLCITIPDVNEAIRPLNGRLTRFGLPFPLLQLLRNLRRIRTARLVALGVLPQFHNRGIAEMFILRAIEVGAEQGVTGAELGWTLEDNDQINRPIEKVGAERYKRFRIFSKSLI
jgi:GNAT superfamily N-acetyltransferase